MPSHLRVGLPSGLFPSDSPTKTPYTPRLSPIRATCPAHLILLDFITRKMLCEEYRSSSFSLCRFLHSLVTSSLLGPNIHFSPLFSNTFSLRPPSMKTFKGTLLLYAARLSFHGFPDISCNFQKNNSSCSF